MLADAFSYASSRLKFCLNAHFLLRNENWTWMVRSDLKFLFPGEKFFARGSSEYFDGVVSGMWRMGFAVWWSEICCACLCLVVQCSGTSVSLVRWRRCLRGRVCSTLFERIVRQPWQTLDRYQFVWSQNVVFVANRVIENFFTIPRIYLTSFLWFNFVCSHLAMCYLSGSNRLVKCMFLGSSSDVTGHCFCVSVANVFIWLESRLQPNTGNTLGRVSMVFMRSAIIPPKVHWFGWNLEHSGYIVWGWPWQILDAIRTVTRGGEPGEILSFCQVNNAWLTDFPSSKFHEIWIQHVYWCRFESFRNRVVQISP